MNAQEKTPVSCPFCGFSPLDKPEDIPQDIYENGEEIKGIAPQSEILICPGCKANYCIDYQMETEFLFLVEPSPKKEDIRIIHNYLVDLHAIDIRLPDEFDVNTRERSEKAKTPIAHLVFWRETRKKGRQLRYRPDRKLTAAERKRLQRAREKDKLQTALKDASLALDIIAINFPELSEPATVDVKALVERIEKTLKELLKMEE